MKINHSYTKDKITDAQRGKNKCIEIDLFKQLFATFKSQYTHHSYHADDNPSNFNKN